MTVSSTNFSSPLLKVNFSIHFLTVINPALSLHLQWNTPQTRTLLKHSTQSTLAIGTLLKHSTKFALTLEHSSNTALSLHLQWNTPQTQHPVCTYNGTLSPNTYNSIQSSKTSPRIPLVSIIDSQSALTIGTLLKHNTQSALTIEHSSNTALSLHLQWNTPQTQH